MGNLFFVYQINQKQEMCSFLSKKVKGHDLSNEKNH